MTMTAPGSYVLTADLSTSGNCLTATMVAGIRLDCQGHRISAGLRTIVLTNVNAASVINCTLVNGLFLSNTTSTVVTNNVIPGAIAISADAGDQVTHNTITPPTGFPAISIGSNSSNEQITGNTITVSNAADAVDLTGGTGTQVTGNTITADYDGSMQEVGTDDGIILFGETGDLIQGNIISRVFDAGVEGVGTITNTTIANNFISNVGYTGIGGYWCTRWTGNTVEGNHVSAAQSLGRFYYASDATRCRGTIAPPLFSMNQFIGNVFRDPAPGTVLIAAPGLFVNVGGPTMGNVLQGNDFGTNNGPWVVPLSGFIDGGGNICAPISAATSSANFVCTGGGFQSNEFAMPWSASLPPPRARGPSRFVAGARGR
jgi:hypothetical protein